MTHMCVCVCTHVCTRVRMCELVRVISGLSIQYRLTLTHYALLSYIPDETLYFIPCGTISLYFYFQLTWRNVRHPITRLNRVRRISLTRRGTW